MEWAALEWVVTVVEATVKEAVGSSVVVEGLEELSLDMGNQAMGSQDMVKLAMDNRDTERILDMVMPNQATVNQDTELILDMVMPNQVMGLILEQILDMVMPNQAMGLTLEQTLATGPTLASVRIPATIRTI
jgi:hypothetical protein